MKKENYSESNAFIRKLNSGRPLSHGRYSESDGLVKKAVAGDAVKAREDLDEDYVPTVEGMPQKDIDFIKEEIQAKKALKAEETSEPEKAEKELGISNDDLDAIKEEIKALKARKADEAQKEKEEIKPTEEKKAKKIVVNDNAVDAIKLSTDTRQLRLVIKSEGQSTKAKEKATKTAHVFGMIFTYAFLVLTAILFLFPFYWMIITSFKSGAEIKGFLQGYEGKQTFWPVQFMNNYAGLTKKFNFGMYVGNTLVIGLFSTIGTIITCILSAFAFARLNFKGKDLMFTLLLATMMIPGEMMVVTNYISISNFGWTDGSRTGAYLAMIIPFMVSVFYIYLLRQNFMQIPNELYLAAKVDGKTDWQYLWKVMVPLAMPSLVTIFILKLMGSWNSYIWPNLVAGGHDEFKLVSNGLRDSFQTGTDFNEYGKQMAATVCVTLPLLLLFVCFRKYIMRGVSRAGIKG